MGGIRFGMLKSVASSVYSRSLTSKFHNNCLKSVKNIDLMHVRPCSGVLDHSYHTDIDPRASARFCKPSNHSGFSPTLSKYRVLGSYPLVKMTPMWGYQSYSSSAGGKGDDRVAGIGEGGGGDGGMVGGEWVDKVKDGFKSVVDVTSQKAQETSDQLTPHVQQVLDSNPYLKDIVVPIGGTFAATILAWVAMPRFLKGLHRYSTKGSAVLLSGSGFTVDVPYEKSVWGALQDPARYLATFMAFSEICHLVAPDHVASQYIGQSWKGAVILSFVWFVQRWKTNVVARLLASQNNEKIDRDMLLTLDKVSTVGLLGVGVVAVAEACGVAVQSILTVGGIGGVATAFAAKDILGNVLTGLSMQFSKPFSLGDTIKAGSVEGQVVDMGLTTTSLLNIDKCPVIVPNSTFSSQVIVNKSRGEWRGFIRRIPLQFDNLEKIPQAANDIKSMLNSYPKVFLEQDAPYCYLSQIQSSCAELTVGCNLKRLSRAERYTTEQDILLQSIQIIKQHGLSLGSVPDAITQ
ncbi:mechanosensitive ion channel protein 1, mitochondrial [Silene latifolia]|uniref:mechanosensitive ion channel protein 1, mitochondrial n=1 Tax=Silene latifolia TaxID=37657 RepID=UPI003D77F911